MEKFLEWIKSIKINTKRLLLIGIIAILVLILYQVDD